MILTLTGENGFALGQAQRQLSEAFTAEYGDLALERLDGEDADFSVMREALTSLPLLSPKKLVIIRSGSANKQLTEAFEQLMDEVPETTDVILVEPKLDKRTAYYKLLKSKTDFKEFPELDPAGLARWLVAAAKERGALLNSADARYLIERVGTNQQLLSNELDKLALYDTEISRRNIELLTDGAPQSTIFQLLEAAFGGHPKTVIRLYSEQRALKVEPPQIIAMLAWQLHILSVIKTAGDRTSDQIASEAKLNPFVVRKSQGIARQLSLAQLRKLVRDLLQIDIATKRSAIDPDEALQHYLLTLG